jgi:hypothetical protein
MRLITRKIWRSYPEMDHLDDETCAAFVRQVKRSTRRQIPYLVLMSAGVGFGLTWLASTMATQLGWLLAPQYGHRFNPPVGEWLLKATIVVLLLLLVRAVLLRGALRRALKGQCRCLECRYILLGLPVAEIGHVRCPECGKVNLVPA